MSHKWEYEPEGRYQCDNCGAYRRTTDPNGPCSNAPERLRVAWEIGRASASKTASDRLDDDLVTAWTAGRAYEYEMVATKAKVDP